MVGRECAHPHAAGLLRLRRLETFGLRRSQPAWPDSIKFWTRTKTVTARWPSGIKSGAEFSMPVFDETRPKKSKRNYFAARA